MATRNSTTTPSAVQSQTTEHTEITLLAYDMAHEDILIGSIPVRFFAMRRLITAVLRAGNLSTKDHQMLTQALTTSDQLWFDLMRLGKEHHAINRDSVTIL